MSKSSLDELTQRAIDMARNAPADPFTSLAPKEALTTKIPDLDLFDDTEKSADELKELAEETEALAMNVDGISNSEGATASTSKGYISLATSNGFAQSYNSSNFSLSLSVIAGEGTEMERDYAYSSKRHFADLQNPEEIAKEATERALKRINPRKAETCQVPVVFSTRVSRTLLGHFASAINGASIARGTSFLKDMMNKQVFADGINIVDDPHILRGPSSRPFDGEGLANESLTFIKDGVLQDWILDRTSAKQLNLQSNGRAARGTSSPPSPSSSNIYIAAGTQSPEDMISDIQNGFYVTELIGMGVNGITGDYSRGAAGFWIENGEITYPVNEITIASNLKDMYLNMQAADDLTIKYGTDSPTLLIEQMMIAGS